MSNTYTVTDRDGNVLGRGLTAVEAAQDILTYGGYSYRVEKTYDGAFHLMVSSVPNSSLPWQYDQAWINGRLLISRAETPESAFAEFAEKIVAGHDWRGSPEAMPDEAYDAMLADIDND